MSKPISTTLFVGLSRVMSHENKKSHEY